MVYPHVNTIRTIFSRNMLYMWLSHTVFEWDFGTPGALVEVASPHNSLSLSWVTLDFLKAAALYKLL